MIATAKGRGTQLEFKMVCGATPSLASLASPPHGACPSNGESAVGAVCDRAYFVDSRKSARSQTAPTDIT